MSENTVYLELRKKAEELFPNDEKSQADFVEGFITKTANIFSTAMKTKHDQGSFGDSFFNRGIGQATGKALVGGVAGLGVAGIMSLMNTVSDNKLYNDYLKALNVAVRENRILKAANPKKVSDFGQTIFKFAPHVATDPNLLSSILANAIHGEGIDPMTIRTLTELESRYQDIGNKELFNPKAWI